MAVLTKSFAEQLIAEQGKDVVISNIYTSIADDAFSGSGLTSVVIPDSVTLIDEGAFDDNLLMNVDLPDSITHIGEDAFSNNQITAADIPANFKEIENLDFAFDPFVSISYREDDIATVPAEESTPTTEPTPESVLTLIPKLQTIDDVTKQNQVTKFQLSKSIRVQNYRVEMLISGTGKKDIITGSSEG